MAEAPATAIANCLYVNTEGRKYINTLQIYVLKINAYDKTAIYSLLPLAELE